jgi:hypothetical protein
MKILGIDHELSDRGKKGLAWYYKKYKAHGAAVQLMDQMHAQGTWPLPKKPSNAELVEIFLSKSYWHSHVAKGFANISRYPEMVQWLEREDTDHPSDLDVWHVQRSDYGFRELAVWIANGGTLDNDVKTKLKKGKGKEEEEEEEEDKDKEREKDKDKEKKKEKGKRKGRKRSKAMEESDEDGEDSEDKGGQSNKASGSSKKSHKRK